MKASSQYEILSQCTKKEYAGFTDRMTDWLKEIKGHPKESFLETKALREL